MPLPRAPTSLRAVSSASIRSCRLPCQACSAGALTRPKLFRPRPSPTFIFVRNSTHASEGRANGPKQGPGKRLGAKKTGEQYVIPGNIIFRQRGTQWHPGENVGMGRDHTIYATQPGFVKYYRNPQVHPKRRYIGVVLRRTDVLPRPPNAARRRRLGMVTVPRTDIAQDSNTDTDQILGAATLPTSTQAGAAALSAPDPVAALVQGRKDAYREANWWIGRAADRAATSGDRELRRRVTPHKFVKKDRFAALKMRKKKAEKAAERRALLGPKKGGKKKSGRRGR